MQEPHLGTDPVPPLSSMPVVNIRKVWLQTRNMKKHLEQHQLAEVVPLRSPIKKSWSPPFEHDRAVLQCQICRQVGAIIRNRQSRPLSGRQVYSGSSGTAKYSHFGLAVFQAVLPIASAVIGGWLCCPPDVTVCVCVIALAVLCGCHRLLRGVPCLDRQGVEFEPPYKGG